MFNWLKWHQSLLNWVSPSFIGDIIGAVGGAITGNPLGAIGLGANIIGGLMGSDAASSAAASQAAAANNAAATQLAMFNTQNSQLAPSRATGYSGLNQIASMLPGTQQTYDAQGNPIGTQTGSGYLTQQFPTYQNFTNADLNAQLAPNYQWQLGQGQQATNAQNNATGGLVGGNALKGLQDYTQNFAGSAYQNALNNYMAQQQLGFNQNQTQRGNIYNTLASIAGLGQSAQQTGAQLSANTANAVSNLGVGAANANAAGTIGSTNAITGALSNTANMYALGNILGQKGTIPGVDAAGGIMNFNNPNNYDANGVYTGPGALPDTSNLYNQ